MNERCLFFNLNSFTRQLNKLWDHEFGKLALSAPHAYMLRLIIEQPGITQRELADELDLGASTVTRFLDSLEGSGFVSRACCPDDARAMKIRPTKKGQALGGRIEDAMKRLQKELDQRLGEKVLVQLVDTLQHGRKKFVTGAVRQK